MDTSMDRFQRQTVQVAEVTRRIESYIKPLDVEEVPLYDAFGRRLAEDVVAPHPFPHFRRSGMDGFAVRTEDIRDATPDKPVRIEVIETIPCGSIPNHQIHRGTAARIMTGAMVPEEAEAVVMFEVTHETTINGKSYVTILKPSLPGQHISPIGSEVAEGSRLLARGTQITAGEAAVLATFGHDSVNVFRKPKVAIISTGSELVDVSQPLKQGKIRNSNSYMLACRVRELGCIPIVFETLADDLTVTRTSLESAFRQADVVITTGGVSVGDYDVLASVFNNWPGQLLCNKIAMRPGSATRIAALGDQLLFGLSGNPGACFIGFELFVRPVLLGMQGKEHCHLPRISANLEEDFSKGNAFTRFVRSRVTLKDESVYVKPVGTDKSSIMISIKDANGLIVIPPGGRGPQKGEAVEVLLLNEQNFC